MTDHKLTFATQFKDNFEVLGFNLLFNFKMIQMEVRIIDWDNDFHTISVSNFYYDTILDEQNPIDAGR